MTQARSYTDDVQFSAEDATRSDLDFLCRVVEAVIKAGATTINLPDTVGYSTPDEIGEFFTDILGRVPNADKAVFSAHCHDDLGLAVANTLAALQAGVRQVECTINGIGERAGNASLEEIVMATRVRPDRLPFDDRRSTRSADLRDEPAADARSPANPSRPTRPSSAATPSRTKPAFTRTACSRTAGPTRSCVPRTSACRRRRWCSASTRDGTPCSIALQQLGIELSRLELDRLYRRMIALADAQKTVTDAELVEMSTRSGPAVPNACPRRASASPTTGGTRWDTGMACRGVRSEEFVRG